MFKRLDCVVALESNRYLTKGEVYTVLGVRGKGHSLLIATKLKKKIYLSSSLFKSEEEQNREVIERLEDRGF